MTNKERIFDLPNPEMIKELHRLFNHPLSQFIDYNKYFNAETADITFAIKSIGTGTKKPSMMETQAYINANKDDPEFEQKLNDFIQDNTVPCVLLEKTSIFNQAYWTILDPRCPDHFVKVPKDNVVDIVLKENYHG